MKIGLVGQNGAGKSAVCTILKKKGFHAISLSDAVRVAATAQGLELSRENLIATGTALKAKFGPDILAKQSVDAMSEFTDVVFDSVRLPEEALFLKKQGALLIGIEAPLDIRYARIRSRKNSTDNVTFEVFKAQDEGELNGASQGQNIGATLSLCDHKIDNKYGLDWLIEQLDHLLSLANYNTMQRTTHNG